MCVAPPRLAALARLHSARGRPAFNRGARRSPKPPAGGGTMTAMRKGAIGVVLLSCASSPSPAAPAPGARSIDDDLALIQAHAPVVVLESAGGGRVVVSPAWQGRVMTSA